MHVAFTRGDRPSLIPGMRLIDSETGDFQGYCRFSFVAKLTV